MILGHQHLIIGVKLITMHGAELELCAGNEWRLAIWNENDRPESGREIGPGALIRSGAPDFRDGECG